MTVNIIINLKRRFFKMKKLFITFLIMVLLVSASANVFASDNHELQDIVLGESVVIINEQFEIERAEQIEQIERYYEGIGERSVFVDFRTVWGSTRRVTVAGFAGNQDARGTRFTTGGSFFHSAAGGPSASVSVSFGAPFASVSISSNLGNAAGSGFIVNVPDRVNFFKLHVAREYEITPFRTYGIHAVTGQWIIQSEGTRRTHIRTTLSAVRV